MLNVQVLKNYVGADHAAEVEALLTNCDESKLQNITFKNPKVALILSILVGFLGIDRLYQGGIKMMLYKWGMVLMSFGTWCIADFYFTKRSVEQDNYNKLIASINVAAMA